MGWEGGGDGAEAGGFSGAVSALTIKDFLK